MRDRLLGALQGGAGVHVEASWGTGNVPAGHSVVVGTTDRIEALVDVPIDAEPAIQVVDHPGRGSAGHKLLLVHGPDEDGVGIAAARLGRLRPEYEPGAPPVRFLGGSEYDPLTGERTPGRLSSIHVGTGGETLTQAFAVATGALSTDVTGLEVDLEVTQRQPLPFLPTRIDVELNGRHLTTLDPPDDCLSHRHTLELPRHLLLSVNRLSFHVAATQVPPLCDSWSFQQEVRTSFALSSEPRLVTGAEIQTAGIESFALTALPFSRDPGGRRTAVVLPPDPLPGEVGSALSLVSYLGASTGTAQGEVIFATTDDLAPPAAGGRDAATRDLLIVGERQRLSTWRELEEVLAMGTRMSGLEILSAAFGPDAGSRSTVVQSLPSPLDGQRAAILVSAADASSLPAGADLRAYASTRAGDQPGILVLNRGHAAYLDPDMDPGRSESEIAAGENAAACHADTGGSIRGAAGLAVLALVALLGLCLRFPREDS